MRYLPINHLYLPEGFRPSAAYDIAALRSARENGTILEGPVLRCGVNRTLHVSLGNMEGMIPREEALSPWISGAGRDISLLTCVGNPVCFQVTGIDADQRGAPRILLSRRRAQETAKDYFLKHYTPGTVISARITHLESFGAFADIGCGIIAMLPIENISFSRIKHPSQRFHIGQKILSVIAAVNPAIPRFTLSHKELLGTWLENASLFQPGETVPGIVRAVKDYGCFIELTPNLSGLAEWKEGIAPGDRVSVYIKSIRPERMKIKLQIIRSLPDKEIPAAIRYQITDGQIAHWVYSPPNYEKAAIETTFTFP
ncbi:MAG: S1 RNA-binding domain-containing protein [Ruminococcaceae bacterium]|nr:S1 RNA-binding domain-containing protein [Oscillospiraceae bacterium]